MKRFVVITLLVICACVSTPAQSFSLPCKKYPASVPYKCDAAVDYFWHVTSVKCLGPSNGGYKFRISGRANKSRGRESIDLLYLQGGISVSVAGSYSFPAIEEGKPFSFDIVSAFKGYAPRRFNGFLIISRPLQAVFRQKLDEEERKREAEELSMRQEAESASTQQAYNADATANKPDSSSPETETEPTNTSNAAAEQRTDQPYPSFPGGAQALITFLQNNIKYPTICEEAGIQGRVVVSFFVEPDGSLSDISIVKSVAPALDNEAIRLVNIMPKWIPAYKDGEKVRMKFAIPITFKL